MDEKERTQNVDAVGGFELGDCDVGEEGVLGYAGVVDDDVYLEGVV